MDNDRSGPLLHRENWLYFALDVLMSDCVEQVKVLNLRACLTLSRSSFHFYFRSRKDLLGALLNGWRKSITAVMIAQTNVAARRIVNADCNVFRCVIDGRLFNGQLDFAVSDWSRCSGKVRRIFDCSDLQRLDALVAVFARFNDPSHEAIVRARVLHFM
jgi:AcrR family transcriptional regulator